MSDMADVPEFILGADFRHRHMRSCGSTNSELLMLDAGHDRLWLTADAQSGGRGRSGRQWMSEPGNLFASVRLEDPSSPQYAAGLSFVLALAAKDAIDVASANQVDIELKWPNDIVVEGAKLAGILLEATSASTGIITAICGVGVNCAHAPDGSATLYRTTSLAEQGCTIEPADLFAHLWSAFNSRLAQWNRGHGMASICKDWKRAAAGIGSSITARTGGSERRGIFRDITPEGHLLLETSAGMETITAADIFLA
ncbi:MAG: biotin--[acetyl-CoA-carboxylase] ligase [Pseudomonadota bacterium]